LALALVVVGAFAGACSLFVDTGGLDTDTDDAGSNADAGGDVVVGLDAPADVNGASDGANDATNEAAVDASDAAACPSGPGPAMVPIPGGYCIDSTEVTRAQYAAFLATTPSTSGQPAECSWNTTFVPNPWDPNLANYPVADIDWCDAYAYCKWAGKRLCGKIGGGALAMNAATDPNASQWYRACSAGASLTYPYGTSYVAGACNAPTGSAQVAPVASFPNCVGGYPGLYDMAGNVEEWQDSCSGTSGASDACREQSGTYGYVSGDPQGSTRCDFLDTDTRSAHLDDVGVRCCAP
jgi:sulfatase modifying factor 1